jgi:hypothetical protein
MTDDPCAICGENPSIYSTKHAVEHAAISEYVSAQGRVSRAGLRRESEALRIAISLSTEMDGMKPLRAMLAEAESSVKP